MNYILKFVRWATAWAWKKERQLVDGLVQFESMSSDPKSFEARAIMNPHYAQAMAHSFAELAFNAPNYVEMQFQPKAVKHRDKWMMITVTVQKHDGKTPHQLRLEADAKVEELTKKLNELEATHKGGA